MIHWWIHAEIHNNRQQIWNLIWMTSEKLWEILIHHLSVMRIHVFLTCFSLRWILISPRGKQHHLLGFEYRLQLKRFVMSYSFCLKSASQKNDKGISYTPVLWFFFFFFFYKKGISRTETCWRYSSLGNCLWHLTYGLIIFSYVSTIHFLYSTSSQVTFSSKLPLCSATFISLWASFDLARIDNA